MRRDLHRIRGRGLLFAVHAGAAAGRSRLFTVVAAYARVVAIAARTAVADLGGPDPGVRRWRERACAGGTVRDDRLLLGPRRAGRDADTRARLKAARLTSAEGFLVGDAVVDPSRMVSQPTTCRMLRQGRAVFLLDCQWPTLSSLPRCGIRYTKGEPPQSVTQRVPNSSSVCLCARCTRCLYCDHEHPSPLCRRDPRHGQGYGREPYPRSEPDP